MSLPTMDEFEVKNADLGMEEDSEPEINDIGFDAVINENENEFLEYSSNDDDIQDVSDQEILDSLAKKRPRLLCIHLLLFYPFVRLCFFMDIFFVL